MHPSCRSYRVQERRSMPTRELGFYSCRSGSRTTRPRAPLQYNHEQASSSDTDILIPEADLAGGGGSSARARRLVHKTGARPGFRHGRAGHKHRSRSRQRRQPLQPYSQPRRQYHNGCRENADSTSTSRLLFISRYKRLEVLELMFSHCTPEWLARDMELSTPHRLTKDCSY